MDCTEIQKEITPFLARELDDKTAEKFVLHVKKCDECKEELAISYLVTEGMKHLEDGSAFDLNKELSGRLDETIVGIIKRRNVTSFLVAVELLSVVVLAVLCGFVLY